jgi:hypothetical protein
MREDCGERILAAQPEKVDWSGIANDVRYVREIFADSARAV